MEELINQLNKYFAERYSFSCSHGNRDQIVTLYEASTQLLSNIMQLDKNWDEIDIIIYSKLIEREGKQCMSNLQLFYRYNNNQLGPAQRLFNELNNLQKVKANTIEEKKGKLGAIREISDKIDLLLERYNIEKPKLLEKK